MSYAQEHFYYWLRSIGELDMAYWYLCYCVCGLEYANAAVKF